MTMVSRFLPNPSEVNLQHVLVPRQGAPLWEQALVSLWFLTTFVPFPNDELILYPIVLYFIGSTVLRYEQVVPVILKSWPVLLVPFLAGLSMFWSPASGTALRFGLMMSVTAIAAIYIATRLTPREIIRAAFFACAVSAVVAISEVPLVGTPEGLYSQKNIFSIRMQLITIVSLGVAFDRGQNIALRALAVPFAVLTAVLVTQAESATALLLAGGSVVVMVSAWLIWTNVSRVEHLRTLMALALGTILITGALLFLNAPNNTFVNDGLFLLGKDSTLTNRTVLWADAARIAEQRPWFGVGAGGFWIAANGQAESILDYSFKDPGTQFSFHSVFFEVMVHLGRIGLVCMLIQIGWVLVNATRHWTRNPGMPQALLLLIALSTIVVSFTESYLFGVFEIAIVLFLIAGISAVSEEAKFRRVLAPPMPPMTDMAVLRP